MDIMTSSQTISFSNDINETDLLSIILSLCEYAIKNTTDTERILVGAGLHKIAREYLIDNEILCVKHLLETMHDEVENELQKRDEAFKKLENND